MVIGDALINTFAGWVYVPVYTRIHPIAPWSAPLLAC